MILRNRLKSCFSWKPSWAEALFFLPTFALALAFEMYGDRFGKRGISVQLPAMFGSIPNFQPKLFPMELYLAIAGVLTLAQVRRWPRIEFWNRLTALVLFLMAFGAVRTLPDLRTNPIFVIRNCAFLWYLSLPLMIALYPITSLKWERFFQVLYLVSFLYFVALFPRPFLEHDPTRIFWFIDLGLILALAYGLTSASTWFSRLTLGAIGFHLGMAYFSSLQRTTIVALVSTVLLLLISPFVFSKFPRPRWLRSAWPVAGFLVCVAAVAATRAYDAKSNAVIDKGIEAIQQATPNRKSETDTSGIEQFRSNLWRDAWHEFTGHPFVGIGFLQPVVYRVYAGQGRFFENSGSFEYTSMNDFSKTTPPLSGPHNSYLNALARMGIAGAGVLLLHLICAWLFISEGYFACFFILLWQMLYAFFNVGFEGPIRSFPLLVLMGVALRLAVENSRRSSGGKH
jgi:hypothetical protein